MVFINLNGIIFVPDQSEFLAISPCPKETKTKSNKTNKTKTTLKKNQKSNKTN